MSTNVGEIDLELLLNSKQFQKQLNGIKGQANSASSALTSSFKKMGAAIVAAFSVKKIVEFSKACIDLGSDMAEVENVVDTAFPHMESQVDRFANSCIESFGLSTTVAKKYLGTFGAMSKAFGFTENAALEMSETLTGLAGDVASFYNMSSDEAYTKIKSVFTGETETLKELGVVMTQNALDQYALANGYGKTTAKMTEQEKVALRYAFVQEQLSLASGDFIKTQGSWANQTRILTLRFEEFKATIGQGLINIFTPVIQVINTVLAKLQVLANAFKSFTDFIMGNKNNSSNGMGAVANDLSNVTENANDASSAVGGIGSSAKKTAKELKKSLAGFDEINKLDDNSDSSSGSGGVGGVDFGTADLSDAVENSISALTPFINKLQELANIFKEGFKISFGDTNFDGILGHLNNIKKTLIDIWTDPAVLNSANNWANTLMYTLGQVTGAVARIGVNIAEFFVGSIDKYLSQNTGRIKNFIINMFDISSEGMTITGNFAQALGEISDVFSSDTAKQIGANILAMFANPFMSAIELCSKFVVDIQSILMQPIIDNSDKIREAIENTLTPIETITGTLSEAFTYIGDKCNEVYDTYLHPFFESLKTGISDTFGKFLDIYNEYIVPFLDYVANGFNDLWEQHLKPLVDKLGEFIGSIIELLQMLWENWLKPLIDWIIENVIPKVVPILESIWDTVSSVFGSIADTIGGIIETLTGLIDFIVGVFTGDWDKAWEGIKTFFSGIWNTMKGIVSTIWNAIKGVISIGINAVKATISTALEAIKSIWNRVWTALKTTVTNIFQGIWNAIKGVINSILSGIEAMANGIVRGVNKIIDTLNNLQVHIPDWVPLFGDKTLGFNINHMGEVSLPRLAQGGFVKANTPQLAMIGDNKTQGEIVAPEGKMLEMVLTALKLFKAQENNNRAQNGDFTIENNIILDGEVIQRSQSKRNSKMNLATNGRYA